MGIKQDEAAARLLLRVSKNISQFSANTTVNILTSAVVQCTKAGFRQEAYNIACKLVKPENRDQIAEKYKKKIENIARKTVREPDPEENQSPCPFCANMVNE